MKNNQALVAFFITLVTLLNSISGTPKYVGNSDSNLDVSSIVLDSPAGKHGFLTKKNGHFYFEDGTRIRFWGTNMSYDSNFPTKQKAKSVADELASLGFNIVRLHHMDSEYNSIFDNPTDNTRKLDEEKLDRLDYFIYCLKEKGIYVDINLHVSRSFTINDGVVDADKIPYGAKYVTMFDDYIIELQKEYAKTLLEHYNPYTKTTYNNEPAIALVEITNENSLFSGWYKGYLNTQSDNNKSELNIPSYYSLELDKLWNNWLTNKYGNTINLYKAWGVDNSNLIEDGDFQNQLSEEWTEEIHYGNKASFEIDLDNAYNGAGSLKATIEPAEKIYEIQYKQLGITLQKDKIYTLSFMAKAEKPSHMGVAYGLDVDPYTILGLGEEFTVSTEWRKYEFDFIPTREESLTRVSLVLGFVDGEIWFDDIELRLKEQIDINSTRNLESKNINRPAGNEILNLSSQAASDITQFYYELEKNYFEEMISFIHKELKIKIPITTSNNYRGQADLMAQNVGDYLDTHHYWDHPLFPNTLWDMLDFTIHNKSLIRLDGNTLNKDVGETFLGRLSLSAIEDKPFVVSEWNHVFPNDYEYEMAPTIAAYGLLQDWDGLFIYSYSHGNMAMNNNGSINSWFDIEYNPIKKAQMYANSIMFIRGDINKAINTYYISYNFENTINNYKYYHSEPTYNLDKKIPANLIYISRIRKDKFNAKSTTKVNNLLTEEQYNYLEKLNTYVSDTNELIWDNKLNKEKIIINSDMYQGFIGFINKQYLNSKNMDIYLLGDCSLTLVSLDSNNITDSNNMLLTAVGKQKNIGQVKSNTGGLSSWGNDGVITQDIEGTIKLRINNTKNINVYPIDGNGEKLEKIKILRKKDYIQFKIGGYNVMQYIITKN